MFDRLRCMHLVLICHIAYLLYKSWSYRLGNPRAALLVSQTKSIPMNVIGVERGMGIS